MQNHRGSFGPAGMHQMTQFGMRPRTGRDRPAKDETGHTVIIDPGPSQMWLTWSMTLLKSLTSTILSPSVKHMGCSSPLGRNLLAALLGTRSMSEAGAVGLEGGGISHSNTCIAQHRQSAGTYFMRKLCVKIQTSTLCHVSSKVKNLSIDSQKV